MIEILEDVSSRNDSYFCFPSQYKLFIDSRSPDKIYLANRQARPGARFLKAPETFRARKAIFSSSVSENGEVYTLETFCMKRAFVYINNT